MSSRRRLVPAWRAVFIAVLLIWRRRLAAVEAAAHRWRPAIFLPGRINENISQVEALLCAGIMTGRDLLFQQKRRGCLAVTTSIHQRRARGAPVCWNGGRGGAPPPKKTPSKWVRESARPLDARYTDTVLIGKDNPVTDFGQMWGKKILQPSATKVPLVRFYLQTEDIYSGFACSGFHRMLIQLCL